MKGLLHEPDTGDVQRGGLGRDIVDEVLLVVRTTHDEKNIWVGK